MGIVGKAKNTRTGFRGILNKAKNTLCGLLSGMRCAFERCYPYEFNCAYKVCQLKAWKETLLLDFPSLTPSMADFALCLHVEACRKAALAENSTEHDTITSDPQDAAT